MQMEIINILAKTRNLPNIAERLQCYEQAFSFGKEFLIPKITNTDWVLQFVKDVFESFDKPDAEEWCYNQFSRLFTDFDVGPKIYEKLSAWLLKDGLQIVKKCVRNFDYGHKAIAAWGVALKILGQQTLRSSEAINTCISVFPLAFKSSNVQTIKEAFRSWKVIVGIFSKDHFWSSAEVSQEKNTRIAHRLDLIMKALRYKSLPPEVAPEVFDCWWCCCTSLGPRLVLLFEDIAHSLMRYCVGSKANFMKTDEPFESILKSVQSQMETTNVLFLMNQKLETNAFSLCTWNHNPALAPKLLDLLESLICESPALLSAPDFSCFNDVSIVKDHSVFTFQCIRYSDKMCSEKEVIGERISKLICGLAQKIMAVLVGNDRDVQSILFLAQLAAWLKESTLSSTILLNTLENPFVVQLSSRTQDEVDSPYKRYFTELKTSLVELTNFLQKSHGNIPNEEDQKILIDSMIRAQGDIELTLHGNMETTLAQKLIHSESECPEVSLEEKGKEKSQIITEFDEVNAKYGADEKLDELCDENALEIDEAQGPDEGEGEYADKSNGPNLSIAEKVGIEPLSEKIIDSEHEGHTSATSLNNSEKSKLMEENLGEGSIAMSILTETAKKKQEGDVVEQEDGVSIGTSSAQLITTSPMKAIGNGQSPPKTPKSPLLKIRTPSSILRKADSPGSNRKLRRVQFQVSEEAATTSERTHSSKSITSSPYPKRPFDAEEANHSIGASPAKRAMSAFGQSWPIGRKGPSTPTSRPKSVRQLHPIQECPSDSPSKDPIGGEGQRRENGTELYERVKRRLDEAYGEMRREIGERMEQMLEEAKNRMLDIISQELGPST